MKELIHKYRAERPLLLLLLVAFIPRLLATIFSKGFGMHDDHYLIIEAAQSWVDGSDYNSWLPKNRPNTDPTGHSWFYVGLHYYFFSFLDLIGINDPQFKMYIVRLLHGLYSLLIIPPIYFIGKKISNEKLAFSAALIWGLMWFIPNMSVRNLVELVSVPPLMWSTWLLFKESNPKIKNIVFAGLLMGVAMSIRLHMSLFIGGIGLVLLFKKQLVPAIIFGVSVFVSLFITQIGDLFLWGRPFAEIGEYIAYNLANKTTYGVSSYYMYFGTVMGLLLPPLSVAWFIGYLKSWKKYALLFWPSFIFFVFHCYFPNKQERFILPMFPFVVLLGVIWWGEFVQNSKKPIIPKLNLWLTRVFWTVNFILILVVSTSYSKKSRVESMLYLATQDEYNGLIVDYSIEWGAPMLPRFYAENWSSIYYITRTSRYGGGSVEALISYSAEDRPNHALFFEDEDLEGRKEKFKTILNCELDFLIEKKPSFLDVLLSKMNPNNVNETAYIYKIIYK